MEKLSPTVKASLELLRVQPGASSEDLKKSYYQLALLYHPDRNADPQAAVQFRRVTEAYELLLDTPRVQQLNQNHLRERLHREVIDGLSITFGTFFGHRLFHVENASQNRDGVKAQLLTGQVSKSRASSEAASERWFPFEENNSILDHPAFDAIEVIYAGRLNERDEAQLRGVLHPKDLGHLPWAVLNNQGILLFLDGDIKGSAVAYRELCERIPNNIIFTYRLGICLIIEAFQNPVAGFFAKRPDPKKINEGLQLLRRCLRLGAERTVGRQECLAIRKTLADVLEKLGKRSQAKKLWKDILRADQKCAEAIYRVKGLPAARSLILRKQARARTNGQNQRLLR